MNSKMPYIAAINGYALGAAIGLITACDISISAENAIFGIPTPSLGGIPGWGCTQVTARVIGSQNAKMLLLANEKINAEEALRMGLINKIVKQEDLLPEAMKYAETTCKTALSKSGLPGLDYSLNPYTGCEHGCIYCYAPSVLRYGGPEPWGAFVTAKTNIPAVLERELRRSKPGVVGISTVTDPYQPAESRLKLTRSCLEVLLAKRFPICIQTKSALVTRDIDLIKDFPDKEAGLTITALDDDTAVALEPGASRPGERLNALRRLSDSGIPVWAFVGPLVPGFVDGERLADILTRVKDAGASRVLVDRLNVKPGLWARMEPALAGKPGALEACRRALFTDPSVFDGLRRQAKATCADIRLECELLF
jgi:DNA repair photolyase